MPRYLKSGASEFIQADALEYCREHGREFDAIHASPPCQHFSCATAWRGSREDHPDLIAATRAVLLATSLPYVIENVEDAARALQFPMLLCGSQFGLPFRRHRLFECPSVFMLTPHCQHRDDDFSFDHGGKQTETVYRKAIGCDWMTVKESRQAIPPAFTESIGRQLMNYLAKPHTP